MLTLGRLTYTSNKNLAQWMKTFDKMATKIDPLTNTEDKFISQVVKILNVMFLINGPELISDLPKNLMGMLERLVRNNPVNEMLFCNTCNLLGVILDKKNALTEKVLVIVRTAIEKLVEIAKEKVGNWRKSAAILLGKSSFDSKCKDELVKHHGIEVLKSVASFVLSRK